MTREEIIAELDKKKNECAEKLTEKFCKNLEKQKEKGRQLETAIVSFVINELAIIHASLDALLEEKINGKH